MGGKGSGRFLECPGYSLDDLPKFSIDAFARAHGLHKGVKTDFALSNSTNARVCIFGDAIELHVRSSSAWAQPGERSTVHALEHIPCTKGGTRGLLLCGSERYGNPCQNRCRVLYIQFGRARCRKCCGLPYRSQHNDPHAMAFARMQRARARLGCAPASGVLVPQRPRYMHTETYQRLTGEIRAAYGDWLGEEHRRRQRLLNGFNSILTDGGTGICPKTGQRR
jgi:hypothetical protein